MKNQILHPYSFFLVSGILLFVSCSIPTKKVESEPPNIILLLADDLGYADLSAHGNIVFETPNLDKLARQSVQFTHFYVNPVCAPSRASLLTGRDFLRTGVSHVHGGKDFIHLDETLLSETLKHNGYTTGVWGKWHSGNTNGYLPHDRGFDEAYVARLYKHENTEGIYNGEAVQHQGWADSILVDYAMDFIKRSSQARMPYFAFLPFLAPHGPVRAPQACIASFRAKGLSENFATLAAMIYHLDRQIGRLLTFLDRENQLENTVVIFLSDNGPQHMYGFLTQQEDELRNQTPHKGHKGNIWEMGVKSPLFIMSQRFAARRDSTLTSIQDLYPTLVELAGNNYLPKQQRLDGLSLHSVLEGKPAENIAERVLFNFASPGWAPTLKNPYTVEGIKNEYSPVNKDSLALEQQIISVYHKHYKYSLNAQQRDDQTGPNPKQLLFDFRQDAREQDNLASSRPMVTQEMHEKALSWMKGITHSAHAFEVPVYQIDRQLDNNTIKANGPVEISPTLTNTVHSLKGWGQAGDFAIYQLHVSEGGTFEILSKNEDFLGDANARVKLAVGEVSSISMIAEGSLGRIELKKGRQQLKIELLSTDKPLEKNASMLTLLEIRPIDTETGGEAE